MRIGISALLFNLKEALQIVRENKGINHIEIGIDNISDCDKLREYKEEIEKLELSIGIHLPMELNLCEDIVFIRNNWVEFIRVLNNKLSFLEIDYYNMHLGYVMSNRLIKNKEKYLNNAVEFLNELYTSDKVYDEDKLYIEDDKLQITLENTYTKGGDFSNVGSHVKDFEYIFQNINNKNITFCYDTGHDLICSSDYFSLYKEFKVIHLSDNNGVIDEHLGINKGILKKENLEKALSFNPKYLVLEMQLKDINESFEILKENYYK